MQPEIHHEAGLTVVRLHGELDVAVAPKLRTVFNDLINAGHTRLLLDLEDVAFIDSSGLGILVTAYKLANAGGGDVKLTGTRPEVRKIFALTRTDRYFELFDTAVEGRRAFGVA